MNIWPNYEFVLAQVERSDKRMQHDVTHLSRLKNCLKMMMYIGSVKVHKGLGTPPNSSSYINFRQISEFVTRQFILFFLVLVTSSVWELRYNRILDSRERESFMKRVRLHKTLGGEVGVCAWWRDEFQEDGAVFGEVENFKSYELVEFSIFFSSRVTNSESSRFVSELRTCISTKN